MEFTSQGHGSEPPVEGKSSPHLNPAVAPASVAGTPTLKDEDTAGTKSIHDSDSANHVNSHGHVASTPSFTYNVPPNANINSESPHQSSSSTAMINSPSSSSLPRLPPPVPASYGPSFSYNVPEAEIVSFHSSTGSDPPLSAAALHNTLISSFFFPDPLHTMADQQLTAFTTTEKTSHNSHKFGFTLSPTNYGHWKLMIQPFLTTHSLFGYVDGIIPCPPPTISAPRTSAKEDTTLVTQSNPNYTIWLCNDAHVRMLIISTISETSFQHVQGVTSRDLWLGLERAYAPHTSSREFTLKAQLLKIQMEKDETSAAYLARAQEYANAFANIGQPMPDKDIVMLVVAGLREEYNGVKQTLFARQYTAVFNELPGLLEDHEFMIQKSAPAIPNAQAFTAATAASTPSVPTDTVQALQQLVSRLGFQLQPSSVSSPATAPQAFYTNRPGQSNYSRGRGNRGGRGSRGNNFYNRSQGSTSRNSGQGQFSWASNQNMVWGSCNRCGIGHVPSECPKRDPSTFRTRQLSTNYADYRLQASTSWLPDTGSNHHVAPDLFGFDSAESYHGDDHLRVGNGNALPILHIGSSKLFSPNKTFHLNNVLHVPEIKQHLLSVQKFCEDNHVYFEFHATFFAVKDNSTHTTLLTGPSDDGLYSIKLPLPSTSKSCFFDISSFNNHMASTFGTSTFPNAVPREVSSNAANFSYNGNHQLPQKDQSSITGPSVSSASSAPHSVSQHAYSTLGVTSSNPNFASPSFRMPSGPPFQPPLGAPRTPVTPGPPGRPPATPVQPSPSPQQPFYATYGSNPPMIGPPQGVWLQPPPAGTLSRPQLLPYPPAFSGPFLSPAQRMPLPSVPPSNAQPPGTSIGVSDSMPHELPPGTYNSKPPNAVGVKEESVAGDVLDAWSAHRTETGIIYYYNAVTGQSTYQKPVGFKGEPDKVFAQPTPISWEKCAGTDWSLVTTNDGKRYYYNSKTKLSSWQIPTEVTELRKKQESDALKEQSVSVPNVTTLTEKGSGPLSLNAPAITTGGRDAISPVPSSALDLIKKKLQDSTSPATTESDLNGSTPVDQVGKGSHNENGKDKVKDNGDGNISNSSSDSDDVDTGPTKEDRAMQFREMLKERGVAPFSKWEKELPKFVFDPRFKAIPSYSARRAIFDHFVRTRAEEERKEKRAAQKAAIEGYKQLLDEAKEDINHNTDYQSFKRKWGHDPRFEALERKEREVLLNERVIALKRSVEEEARAKRAALVSGFKSMLRENKDISSASRWSKVKDIFRNDPRYKSVKHEDREDIFDEYISDLKESDVEAERAAKAKRDEEEKLRERERVLRKRKEREEQEVERVRSKTLRKEAIESYQALLVETIKDSQVSWTDAKPKLEKDPQGRAANSYLDQSDLEKLFREHIKSLYDRCANEYKALLGEVITTHAATKEYEDGKTVFTSWSTARQLLKDDTRYNKMPRKDRESLWRRHVEDLQRRRKVSS
ncbi:uncharacterized protein LOC143541637 [Bidens hawaiensis]|uniref:uncharacterized protein LOC143541637 n=1 Tax=Bidens hawaiensis TaxID=980011 RepID=UPI00404A9B2C